MDIKSIIYEIAVKYGIDKQKLYKLYKYEKRNSQTVFEDSKVVLDEYRSLNPNEQFYGMAVRIGSQSKKKKTNTVVIDYNKDFLKIKKKYGLSDRESELIYISIKQIELDLNFDSERFSDRYIMDVPDFGLKCEICGSHINFITKQIRSADEGDKTFAVCTKNESHIFSTDRFTIGSEKQDISKEGNILFDR